MDHVREHQVEGPIDHRETLLEANVMNEVAEEGEIVSEWIQIFKSDVSLTRRI